jgi:retron-type reverse transcriptase
MGEMESAGKPFEISKRAVWEAYRKVAANKGAPGVDRVTIAGFEKNLKNNLFKVWNRMSSGSYFPPPVLAVEIPKAGGGVRRLGVPTVADRVAQTVVARHLEDWVEGIFHPSSFGFRPGGRLWTRWRHVGVGAGRVTGCWILTSRSSSTPWTMT